MSTFAFTGGSSLIPSYGQADKVRFVGTWVNGETWTLLFTSALSGNFTLGKGNISGKTFTSVFKFKNRILLGYQDGFALSAIDQPTKWEQQDVGAATIPFTTQYGDGDTAYGFSTITGQLIVFGSRSIQVWSVDADPAKWALAQVLDNSGTKHGLSIQAIGEIDVLYADASGIRSLRSKEFSGNAFISDIGTPIDGLVRKKIKLAITVGYPVCSIIDPITKNYWVFIYDTLYCLSQFPSSKITAWSSFALTTVGLIGPSVAMASDVFDGSGMGVSGTLVIGEVYHWIKGANSSSMTNGIEILYKNGPFTAQVTSVTVNGTIGAVADDNEFKLLTTSWRPVKMWLDASTIYFLTSTNLLYGYLPDSFDYTYALVETNWLDFDSPTEMKQFEAIDISAVGSWKVSYATNTVTNNYITAFQLNEVDLGPSAINSSTFNRGRFAISGHGTHIKLKFECSDPGGGDNGEQPILSAVNIIYKQSTTK